MEGSVDGRFCRLEMPTFDGVNPVGWIYRAECYFSLNHMMVLEMMEATAVCMEGDALAWYQWEDCR